MTHNDLACQFGHDFIWYSDIERVVTVPLGVVSKRWIFCPKQTSSKSKIKWANVKHLPNSWQSLWQWTSIDFRPDKWEPNNNKTPKIDKPKRSFGLASAKDPWEKLKIPIYSNWIWSTAQSKGPGSPGSASQSAMYNPRHLFMQKFIGRDSIGIWILTIPTHANHELSWDFKRFQGS